MEQELGNMAEFIEILFFCRRVKIYYALLPHAHPYIHNI